MRLPFTILIVLLLATTVSLTAVSLRGQQTQGEAEEAERDFDDGEDGELDDTEETDAIQRYRDAVSELDYATVAQIRITNELDDNKRSIELLKRRVEFWKEMAKLQARQEIATKAGKLSEATELASERDELVEAFEQQQWEMELQASVLELKGAAEVAAIEKSLELAKYATQAADTSQQLLKVVQALHRSLDAEDENYLDFLETRIEVLEVLRGALLLRYEMAEEFSGKQHKLVDRLAENAHKLLATIARLHELESSGMDDEFENAEVAVEELFETIENLGDRIELESRLLELRKVGDGREIEEIEEEIDELRKLEDAGNTVVPDRTDPSANDESTNGDALSSQREFASMVALTKGDLLAAKQLDFASEVAPLLKKYCFECHGDAASEGDLNIQNLLTQTPLVVNKASWINVIEQAKNHVMPPEDSPQPKLSERKTMVAWLHNSIQDFDYSAIVDPGFEVSRRLSHNEYNNTIRDLFGIDIRPADRFPADLSATSGFDNSSNSLFIQPLLMERYIGAAEFIVDQALPVAAITKQQEATAKLIFVARPDAQTSETKAAQSILKKFLTRAYRRPPTRDENDDALKRFKSLRDAGKSFHTSVKQTIQGVLISPKFLMRVELARDTKDAYEINQWELANRLSYFLWASMPDDELFSLAASGKLADERVLTAQVTRMLADPKSQSLGTIFAGQWLGFEHLGSRVRPDPIDNPWCTDSLMSAMKSESAMFFNSLVKDNQSITRLVDAKYTFLNQELAKHYRIEGVRGNEMRRVVLSDERRGGIITHGSLLAVTSFPGRTSPVVRGKWVLETLLGTPPPPPPPNVSELSERIERSRSLTQKQKLELHREKPNCNACHSQIDPLGFSLENYDWFGRWRSKPREHVEGELPNGTKFSGPSGLKKVLVEQRLDDLRRQLTEKMLTYALGRQLEYYDEPAVRSILSQVKENDDQLQSLIGGIVRSYPFRYKKIRQTELHEEAR